VGFGRNIRDVKLASGLAVVSAGAILAASASAASAPEFDARWSALQTCLTDTEHGVLSNGIHPNGFVATSSPGHLKIEGSGGFAAAIIYAGTFSRAEALAKRTKKDLRPSSPPGHGAGVAVGNVTFYFTTFSGTVQQEVVTSCLARTYAGQPKWPAHMDLASLPGSGHRGTPEPYRRQPVSTPRSRSAGAPCCSNSRGRRRSA
jgi:hypothetical protein